MKHRLYIYIGIIIVIVAIYIIVIINKRQETPTIFKPLRPTISLQPKRQNYQSLGRKESLEVEEDSESRSRLAVSPNGHYGAYISPFEWEAVGNLYIKAVKIGKIEKLTHYWTDRSNTPKAGVWLNDTLLLVIEGYTWGTCTVGGSLYLVDIKTGRFYPILEPPSHQKVAEVLTHKNSVILRIAAWNEDYMDYKLSTKVLPIDRILNPLVY